MTTTSTLIHTMLFLPGALVDPVEKESDDPSVFDWPDSGLESDCVVWYAVERNTLVDIEEIKTDDEGQLLETIFAVSSMESLSPTVVPPHTQNWIWDYMAECGYVDLDDSTMAELYQIAKKYFDKAQEGFVEELLPDDIPQSPSQLKVSKIKIFNISFCGAWSISMSRGFEESYEEIDAIGFDGEINTKILLT